MYSSASRGARKRRWLRSLSGHSVVVSSGRAEKQLEIRASPRNHLNLRREFAKIGRPDWAAVLRLQVEI